uniref:GRIP domain-containing protein n=2 Tax=Kalanchoe fedtschenkoi TaxID=63787 RepID=A0A7N0V8V6_KALFE
MPVKVDDNSVMPGKDVEDPLKYPTLMHHSDIEGNKRLTMENGLHMGGDKTLDQLEQMVFELGFQNEYLISQFKSFIAQPASPGGSSRQPEEIELDNQRVREVEELKAKLESLNKDLTDEKKTRGAAEEALKHLQEAYAEADAKAKELSAKLSEAEQKMDREIKDRDEKYSELDSKFSRLHKRAKQRIQEVQKEKDDLEVRLREVSEASEKTLSQNASLQEELERTKKQANEAMKAMDLDRQQLRSANNKLRDNLEELRHILEPKENALETLQRSLVEKEQMLENLQGQLQAADEKKQALIAELSAKHQRHLASLEAQLADVQSDRNKATEALSSLQVLLVEKESKLAEMDAASTGEAARLRAAIESMKGELVYIKQEQEKERESWEASIQACKIKLETAEANCVRAEFETAKMRSQMEFELSVQAQLLSSRDSELAATRDQIARLENEFSSYKSRAHALLQKKDAELLAAQDSEQLRALEEALKDAEKEILLVSSERDNVLKDFQEALANHDKELITRDEAMHSVKEQLRSLEQKLDSVQAHHRSEKEAWEVDLKNLEEKWRLQCEALKAQTEVRSEHHHQRDFEDLKIRYKKLKEEHDSFRDLADKMIEEKDREISKLLVDNKNLQRSLETRPAVDNADHFNPAFQKQDASNSNTSIAEQQILILARQQAQREEELAQSQRHILALQEEIEELERENQLHSQQEAILKAELRDMERKQKREGVDMTYLKNVILKLLETGEVEALLPVIGMLLQFSPDEIQKCQQAYLASAGVPPSPGNESSGSGLSLFSRFSF